jgi:class 3 adenylate cyclase
MALSLADRLEATVPPDVERTMSFACKKREADIYMARGLYHHVHSNYGKALEDYFSALKCCMEIHYMPGIALAYNHTGNIYFAENNLKEAMKNHRAALKIRTMIGDSMGIASSMSNMGNVYEKEGLYREALDRYAFALKTYTRLGNQRGVAINLIDMGGVYKDLKEYGKAMKCYQQGLAISKSLNKVFDIADAYIGIGEVYYLTGNSGRAIQSLKKGIGMSIASGARSSTKDGYAILSKVYRGINDYQHAVSYYRLFVSLKDSLREGEALEKIALLKSQYETGKKEDFEKLARQKKERVAYAMVNRQKMIRKGFTAGCLILFAFSAVLFYQKKKVGKENKRSESLLLNILPGEVAEELKKRGAVQARDYETVTVLFTNFSNFDGMSETMDPGQLVAEIDYCFRGFDQIIQKYRIEKIKTAGDSYMCAGGLPQVNSTHPEDVVEAALEISAFMLGYKNEKESRGEIPFEVRIGINTGRVVAGVVGLNKFAYDIWGDTVNLAARMENSGETGKVNISGSTYALVKDKFACSYRGKINAKNKGQVDMYFVDRSLGKG